MFGGANRKKGKERMSDMTKGKNANRRRLNRSTQVGEGKNKNINKKGSKKKSRWERNIENHEEKGRSTKRRGGANTGWHSYGRTGSKKGGRKSGKRWQPFDVFDKRVSFFTAAVTIEKR